MSEGGDAAGMIAVLFADPKGVYSGLPDVDLWDEARDARLYPGPWPVVAHPPCSRWCRLAGLVEARWGYKRGDDGGCFESALHSVRTWGGVLEHPAYSDAFKEFGLPIPQRGGGWQRGICGGWSCQVEQWRYGHLAKKATWLYAFGAPRLPDLSWGYTLDSQLGLVSWCGNRVAAYISHKGCKVADESRPRLGKKAASATPIAFRDALLAIARSIDTPTP